VELLERARVEAEIAKTAAELTYRQVEQMIEESTGGANLELAMDRDPILNALRGAQSDLAREKERLLQLYAEPHDAVRAVDTRLANTQAQIENRESILKATLIRQQQDEARLRYEAAKKQFDDVDVKYNDAAKRSADLIDKGLRYESRLAEQHDLREQLTVLDQGILQERIRAEVSANNVSVRNPAVPANLGDRAGPSLVLYLPLSIVLALVVSLGMALLVEVIDNRVRTPMQVVQQIRLAMLASIPDRREDPQAGAVDELWTVALKAPQSLMAESFRQLRTALMYSTDTDLKSLLVTSPEAGTGKTVLATNLAITLAGGGSRVLLVDANFRRPMLHRVFDLPNSVGLSSVLARLSAFDAAVQRTNVTNLDVLGAGPPAPSPADLLGSEGMQKLLAEAVGRYDTVLIDGPPILVVTDAHVLCSMVDGVALTLSSTETSSGVAVRAKRALLGLRARVVGAVLNRVRATRGGYFREAYKSYYDYAAKEPVEMSTK